MSDFVSEFWSSYVAALTLASIAGCAILLVVMSRARARQAADQAAPEKATTGHVWDGDLTEYNNPLPKWWLNLFWITLFFGIAYLLLFPGFGSMRGMLGWTSSGAYAKERQDVEDRTRPLFEQYLKTDVRTLAANADARAMGERLFLNYCAGCHGSAATGGKGFPNLTDKSWLYGGDPDTIEKSILDGRMGVMPAMGPVIGEENVANVVAYVRSLSRLAHDPFKAQVGKPVFMQNCAACHGADGKGNHAVGAPDLTDEDWLYGSSQPTITESVMRGRHADAASGALAMPAWRATLGEAKAHVLAAYVWGLSNGAAAR
jgi:cytochrome c oxidase cbb3-type subunit III